LSEAFFFDVAFYGWCHQNKIIKQHVQLQPNFSGCNTYINNWKQVIEIDDIFSCFYW
jgi:hypothetical protein